MNGPETDQRAVDRASFGEKCETPLLRRQLDGQLMQKITIHDMLPCPVAHRPCFAQIPAIRLVCAERFSSFYLTVMSSSKALPASVQRFANGTQFGAHRDLDNAGASSSGFQQPSSNGFRQTSWPTAGGGTDEDFGAFVAQRPQAYATSRQQIDPAEASSLSSLAYDGPSNDGAAIQNLFGSSLTDAVDGDWERDLFESQARSAEGAEGLHDPPASRAALVAARDMSQVRSGSDKGKQRADADEHVPGDVSPTSQALLSSLSSLDLSTRSYLKTLLSLPSEMAIEDYLANNSSYTDDVWGLPADVRRVMDVAQKRDEGDTVEEGKQKAVRRLGMVMKHLWAEEGDAARAGGGGWAGETMATRQPARGAAIPYSAATLSEYGDILQHVGSARRRSPSAATATLAFPPGSDVTRPHGDSASDTTAPLQTAGDGGASSVVEGRLPSFAQWLQRKQESQAQNDPRRDQ